MSDVLRTIGALSVLAACVLVSDCGGGPYELAGGGSGNGNSPGGIWAGMDPVSNLAITGLIAEGGQFNLIRSDGGQYVGTAVTSGTTLSATFDGYMPLGQTFPDGARHGHGTLTGTLQESVSINVTMQFTTDVGTTSSGTLVLSFDSSYKLASSLATIAGNYTQPTSGDVFSITSAGAVTWQDASTGCVGNGTIDIIDATFNLYQFNFDLSGCTGSSAVLNGGQFTGLATLNTAVTPHQIVAGATGTANGVTYSLVYTLNAT
jgi:hypothetical protein